MQASDAPRRFDWEMDMFEIIAGIADKNALRATKTGVPSSRPLLTCRWVHDPVDNVLVCRWIAEAARQDETEAASFAVAA